MTAWGSLCISVQSSRLLPELGANVKAALQTMIRVKTGRHFFPALLLVATPAGAIAADSALSFTAHSLNLNPGTAAATPLLLAMDRQGNAYAATTIADESGRGWIRAMKTNAQGAMLAAFQFGGTGTDTAAAIGVDPQGDVVIVGSTTSTDFPVTVSLVPGIMPSAAFVVKLDSGLTRIIASTLLGGTRVAPSCSACGTVANAVAFDSSGDVYVAGGTAAQDFPVTPGAYQITPPGYDSIGAGSSGFIIELSPGLDKVLFGTYYGPPHPYCQGSDCIGVWGHAGFTALEIDSSGAMIASANVQLAVAAYNPQSGTTTVKFAPGGGSVVWSTSINPVVGVLNIGSAALDGSGDIVVSGSGWYSSSTTAGAISMCSGSPGGFVGKLSGSTGAIQFLTNYGCTNPAASMEDAVNAVAVDPSGTIWIAGTAGFADLFQVGPNLPLSYLTAFAPDGSSVEANYTAPPGVFERALAITPSGAPAALGIAGLLMLPGTSGGPSIVSIGNAAAYRASGVVAPAEIVTLYGTGLGPMTALTASVVNNVVQSNLGGYELLFDGMPAPLLYAGSGQINAVVPGSVAGRDSVSVALVTPGGTFTVGELYIRPSQPEIFNNPVTGYATAINQNGTYNVAYNPAHAGEIVSIWGSGAGLGGYPFADGTVVGDALADDVLPVSVLSGNDSLEVDYAGTSPDQVFGLFQVNFRLPQNLASAQHLTAFLDAVSVQLQVGAAISAPVAIYVAP